MPSPFDREALPLSLLNDYLYCSRRAALKIVEGWREANVHTERGDIVHEHTDLAGYEVAKGVMLWRSLPVFSERLGLNGKCDIVEVEPAANPKSEFLIPKSLFPVEFKLGKRRKWENDDAQLCAQALCLEEMFSRPVPRGAVFHADSKRRREVEFTAELRARTLEAVAALHDLVAQSGTSGPDAQIPPLPPAVWKPACEECSLFNICLPRVISAPDKLAKAAAALFRT
jgi:CRISPR-associated exonuclease Cas4